ncbi:hypothetical protein [Rubrivirga sp.]|uniref:hypothetical protein n=1 Tax=Rubrivirga sp. TaxID=1885344 RepID=UPI003C77D498
MRALLLAVALAGSALAQDVTTPGVDGAEAAVQAYIEDYAQGDLTGAIERIEPDEVEEFAGLLARFNEQMGEFGVFDIPKGQTPSKTVAGFIESVMDGEFNEALDTLEGTVIGTVMESDSLAHVVGRSSFSILGGDVGAVNVTTARWDGSRWWVSFGEKLTAFRRGVEAASGE